MRLNLRPFSFLICLLSLVASTGYSQGWKKYPYSPGGSVISFPADEGRHSEEPIEWWYTAGHLIGGSTGTRYSFMLTYFYYPAYGFDGFRILNLGNDDTEQFFRETTAVNYNIMAEDSLNINATTLGGILEFWTNKTDMDENMIPFEYTLSAESTDGAIFLDYISKKPPLILGDDGYFNQGSGSYTYYFSLTKNDVSGTLTIDGVSEEVSGTAWIDRQYGSFNPLTEEDYEWFYIQLSNDMDLNIYNLFTTERELPDTATFKHMSVYEDTLTQYTTHEFEIERLSFYYMPDSGMCYSQKWRLTSSQNNINLIIETRNNNSEVQLPFRFYEGPTNVSGTVNGSPVTGIGFAELLHSYEKPELAITYPSGEGWTTSRALSWDVLNPDDGRPLNYALEYSIDNRETFYMIDLEISDPFYYWTDPPILPGSNCWFRVTAYTVDSTLINTIVSPNGSEYDPNLTPVEDDLILADNKNPFTLYPNPAEDIIFLDLNDVNTYKKYRIIDISGRITKDEKITANKRIQINISYLPPGLYYIGLYSGTDITLSKFIVR